MRTSNPRLDEDPWRGAHADLHFDAHVPKRWRNGSAVHFTPAHVARRAARLLVDRPGRCVLDVGAGVGKFCIIAAATMPEAAFIGIECRLPLVRVANRIATDLGLRNVDFMHGDAVDVDWAPFDAFYFYNPFAEHICGSASSLDAGIELAPAYFFHYVRFVRQRLAAAPVGTRVVTYHGFGGLPPLSYVRLAHEYVETGPLELWVKTTKDA
jgi:SAM-dependent methyltransferase